VTWLWTQIADSPFYASTWVDWLDILLLTAVIYQLLLFMRGTRAMQSLVGLSILGALYAMSERTGLSATHWVLDGLFVYAVLALLILFQEDIRRALARAGLTLGARFGIDRGEVQLLEEVVRAVFSLAGKKIGALIVIEKHARLDPWSEGAHQLDAVVSTELLTAVFHPTSPLHDGALLIRKERVVAAGIFLPLSLSRDLMRTIGTRHRAAVGISEQTDAIALVVSEERGTVTLVRGGALIPIVDATDLRRRLFESMEGDVDDPIEEAVNA